MDQNSTEIYRTYVRQGVAIAWVNSYSGVVIKTSGVTLLFDPVSMEVPDGVSLDVIAVTHGHSDHWDPQLVAGLQRRTQSLVVASPYLTPRLEALLTQRKRTFANQPTGQDPLEAVKSVQPGDELTVGDVMITALRCDHAAVAPLAFQVRTADGVTVYLPGDTTPFPEMGRLPVCPQYKSSSQKGRGRQQAGVGVDVLLWMGTALYDGAQIARLVRPKVFLTYAIAPPAAGVRAYSILTSLAPKAPFHALERHQVFSYPSPTQRVG